MKILIIFALLFPVQVLAETPVYRSQDAQGRVTYSTKPPADAVRSEELKLPPLTPDDEMKRVEDRVQKEKELGDRLERERKDREAEAERRRKETEPTLIIERRTPPLPLIVPNPVPVAPELPAPKPKPGPVPAPATPVAP